MKFGLGAGLAADEQAATRRVAKSKPGRCIDAALLGLTARVCTSGEAGRVHPGYDVRVFLETLDERNVTLSPGGGAPHPFYTWCFIDEVSQAIIPEYGNGNIDTKVPVGQPDLLRASHDQLRARALRADSDGTPA